MRQQVHEQIQILYRYREWEIGFQEAWERFSRGKKGKHYESVCNRRKSIHWGICRKITFTEDLLHSLKTMN